MDKTRVTSDGITVSKPEIVRGDTVFTVWEPNESNAREVVLAGPNASYYKYMQKIPAGYVAEGSIPAYLYKPVIGYDPEVLNRYRRYIIEGEKANDYKSVLGHILDAIRGLKQGGYLQKYASGGKSQNLILNLVMQIIKKAASEILRQSPGEGISLLILLMLDPNGNLVLQTIASQYPEAGLIISAALEYASQLAKKGAKLLKKAGCGCGTTKKLMKLGGRLIEIEVDCNGVPVFAKKGTKVNKMQPGGIALKDLARGFVTKEQAEAEGSTYNNYVEALGDGTYKFYKRGDNGFEEDTDVDLANIKKDYYQSTFNPTTGLFNGETATHYDVYGNRAQTASLAPSGSPFYQRVDNGGNKGFAVGTDVNKVTSTKNLVRTARRQRQLDYWNARAEGVSAADARKLLNLLRKAHHNLLFGWNSKNSEVKNALGDNLVDGGPGLVLATRAKRQALKAQKRMSSPKSSVVNSSSIGTPDTISDTLAITPTYKPKMSLVKNGGYLQRFQPGGVFSEPSVPIWQLYIDPNGKRRSILRKDLDSGRVLPPAGSYITLTVNGKRVAINPVNLPLDYDPNAWTYTRTIKYGPSLNDTIYGAAIPLHMLPVPKDSMPNYKIPLEVLKLGFNQGYYLK